MSRQLFHSLWERYQGFKEDKRTAHKANKLDQPSLPTTVVAPDRTRNVTSTKDFEYSRLNGGASALRLIELLPGTRQEDIACCLYETSLDECAGYYEALSYVWGEDRATTPIQINDATLGIGINLRTSLLNLRDPRASRVLWVDAICIDQNHIPERDQQVAMMGEIYRQASRTVIWLRDQVKETETTLDFLNTLGTSCAKSLEQDPRNSTEYSEKLQSLIHPTNLSSSKVVRLKLENELPDLDQRSQEVMHLLNSDWWNRSWTIQEVLLATTATVMVGPHSIDWGLLCLGGNYLVNLQLTSNNALGAIHASVLMPYISMQLTETTYRQSKATKAPMELLLELLIRCQHRRAKDPRDKIYSLLGLVAIPAKHSTTLVAGSEQPSSIRSGVYIQPEYALPVQNVYSHLACQILRETGSLDVLGACTNAATPKLFNNAYGMAKLPDSQVDEVGLSGLLPSWVPDWSKTVPVVIPLLHDALDRPRTTHATAQSTYRPQFLDEDANGLPTTLLLQAHEITTLVELTSPLRRLNLAAPGAVNKKYKPEHEHDSLLVKLQRLGSLFKSIVILYEELMNIVPYLSIYAEWEEFVRKEIPTKSRSITTLGAPARRVGDLGSIEAVVEVIEEPEDELAEYWQTLCTGTYPNEDDSNIIAPGRGPKIAAQQLFYSWRASLKPIRDLYKWRAESKLRPIGFLGYIRKTWNMHHDFLRLLECSFGRRLARGANGYLCLVPASAMKGDVVVLAKGGKVPLILRPGEDQGTGSYWQLVGEAYIHQIMEGQGWNEESCKEFNIR